MKDGTIIEKRRFPSPHPGIHLYSITYLSHGLKVKGLLAEPIEGDILDGFLYLRGGIKNVGKVRPGRIVQFAAQGFIVFAPFYRGNQGGKGMKTLQAKTGRMPFLLLTCLKTTRGLDPIPFMYSAFHEAG